MLLDYPRRRETADGGHGEYLADWLKKHGFKETKASIANKLA
jgi:hypothetical protein